MRRLVTLLLFIPVIASSQSLQSKIVKSETKLKVLYQQADSILSSIEDYKFQKIKVDLNEIGLPYLDKGEVVVYHSAFALVYAEHYEQAKWVAHIILPDVAKGNEGRTNDFRTDAAIVSGSAVEADYFTKILKPDSTFSYIGYGFDRGHLAPSADFRYSKKALSESYLYSNMSPQVALLNRGRWAELEDAIRQYVLRNNTQVYVVTGGVLRPGLKKIEKGINKVSIPEQYFKVALDNTNQRGIGFLMPNKECEYPIMHYAVSIDSIETLTGIKFFTNLPSDKLPIKKSIDINKWVGEREKGDELPLDADRLPPNTFNTIQAQYYKGRNEEIKVCGTVVSTKLSSKGNIFISLDKKFPNQIFTINIFKDKVINFSYHPDTFLVGKKICVTGKISDYNGTPAMSINNETDIQVVLD